MSDSQHQLQSERGSEEQPSEEVALTLKKSKDGDVRKGQAVKRQLVCINFFLLFLPLKCCDEVFMGQTIRYTNTAAEVNDIWQSTPSCKFIEHCWGLLLISL